MTAPRRTAKAYVSDLTQFSTRILQYVQGKNLDDFLNDTLLQDALIRNLELLGEASKQLLDVLPNAKARFPSIPFNIM
jgi:uncharacterized protein with HEPN domain